VTSPSTIDWEGRYREGSTGWERQGLNPAFIVWREMGFLIRCRILVPGAGRSPEPVALAEAGFEVTAVDAAPSAVAVQRARFEALRVRATVVEADLLAWEPDAPFEAIYDQTCLCALPPSLWPEYLVRLRRWLLPGGRLFVLFMQTGHPGGPPFDCPIAEMRRLFGEDAWEWPGLLPERVAHSAGRFGQPAVLVRR
jgi:methyl halide transferase